MPDSQGFIPKFSPLPLSGGGGGTLTGVCKG